MSGGEDYAILLDEDGMPMPYQCLFVTKEYRNTNKASNTCRNAFEQLKLLEEICRHLKIDLIERCRTGNFLEKSELELLARWSKVNVDKLRIEAIKVKSRNIVSLKPPQKRVESARATIVGHNDSEVLSSTVYTRLTVFAKYIGWLEETLFPSKGSKSEEFLKSKRPETYMTGASDVVIDDDYRSLTSEQVRRVLEVVHPDSEENPWKSYDLRCRNQLIVLIFQLLGCRRGELLRIRVRTNNYEPDIKKNERGTYSVTIRHGLDEDDKRVPKPQNKTVGRKVPLIKRVAELYEDYLIYSRSQVSGSEFIPYLFITHNHKSSANNALSLSALNKVFRDISEVVGFIVDPHSLRHTWNDKFSELMDRKIAAGETNETKSEADRRKLMGWSDNSREAQRYAKRHINKRAFEMGEKLQEEQVKDTEVIQYEKDNPF
ncbi:site-specific integrase [Vibrio parahaemolyticus]|nr:site-specific integrase [Vibrio parahaemolyticus]ELA9412273.1 site-specific integrase [Vibrio parahaemolyticus]ELA9439463.1 site-specific integrase [Vibrio parahaemolyticus]ELZ7200084.1 site-specific integrase [Vibrio parahaemolyticus]HCG8042805.1 site-specific integrase [Vibrio parahaemolyticus]